MAMTAALPEADAYLRYEVVDLYAHVLQRKNEGSFAQTFLQSTLADAYR
jgi:hypothetical protein